MPTININDIHLEKRIAEKSRLIGKSSQEIVKDLLANALPETNEGLNYQKLNAMDHGYFIGASIDEDIIGSADVPLFSQVEDSENYIEDLRKNIWRK